MNFRKATTNQCPFCLSPLDEENRLELPGFTAYPLQCDSCGGLAILCRQNGNETLLVTRGATDEEEIHALSETFPRSVEGQQQTLLNETAVDNPFFQYFLSQLLANNVTLFDANGNATTNEAALQAFTDTFGEELSPDQADVFGIDTYLSCPLTGSYMFAKSDGEGGYSYAETVVTNGYFNGQSIATITAPLLEWALFECDYLSELKKSISTGQ